MCVCVCVLQCEHPLTQTIDCIKDVRSFVTQGGISSEVISLPFNSRSEEVSLAVYSQKPLVIMIPK